MIQKKINILLADDDLDDMDILNDMFAQHASFNILERVQNGQQIIDYIDQNNMPDVILTDMYMPILNGIEVAEQLLSRQDLNIENLLIIINSTSINSANKEKFKKFGMINFYEKPNSYLQYSQLPEQILLQLSENKKV
jgi:CheY-like chemotaxis protein